MEGFSYPSLCSYQQQVAFVRPSRTGAIRNLIEIDAIESAEAQIVAIVQNQFRSLGLTVEM